MAIILRADDLSGPETQALIRAHLANSAAISPPESIHALDMDGLQTPGVSLWSAWEGTELLAIGGLRELEPEHGEIKSMHTAAAHRGKGIGTIVLRHLIAEARRRGYRRLSLETGSQDGFAPSRALYAKHGFAVCGPYAHYRADPNSVFMTLAL